ncbi:GNAT family N-acetyltransferase [Luteococcus sp. Sow4_B9]|uniref:GNAT family N-acetyltransferase n=1 Tax=Luteococcus sp. Sow4_B9 TaxID=3438792 RepID=UPI003F9D91DE
MNISVALKNEKKRYEATVDGQLAGTLSYEIEGDVLDLQHTVVEPAHEGQGVGGELVKGALDHMRSIGKKAKPTCPFVADWIQKNPEYQDMVA